MNRSELIARLARKMRGVPPRDTEMAVYLIQDYLRDRLGAGERIEIRNFGSFTVRVRPPKLARNPKNGAPVPKGERLRVHFKAGKELRNAVDSPPAASVNEPEA
jgi:integration host factor subunit beta